MMRPSLTSCPPSNTLSPLPPKTYPTNFILCPYFPCLLASLPVLSGISSIPGVVRAVENGKCAAHQEEFTLQLGLDRRLTGAAQQSARYRPFVCFAAPTLRGSILPFDQKCSYSQPGTTHRAVRIARLRYDAASVPDHCLSRSQSDLSARCGRIVERDKSPTLVRTCISRHVVCVQCGPASFQPRRRRPQSSSRWIGVTPLLLCSRAWFSTRLANFEVLPSEQKSFVAEYAVRWRIGFGRTHLSALDENSCRQLIPMDSIRSKKPQTCARLLPAIRPGQPSML